MEDNGLPAEPATAVSKLVLILLFTKTNIFTLSTKQQKYNVSEESKNFSADGSEYNAGVDFLLFA